MDSSSLSSQSSLSRNWNHDVFLNFHGADVRRTFLSHLLKKLKSKGTDAFIDNNIERSKSIGAELIEAIRGSKISIVLLSRNYASSTWCLEELVEIMKCRQELDRTVMTIFYEVDPSHVKTQNGDFGKIFEETCQGKTKEEIETWRKALGEVAKIAGYRSSIWESEAAMIEKISMDVSKNLIISTLSSDFDQLLGMGANIDWNLPQALILSEMKEEFGIKKQLKKYPNVEEEVAHRKKEGDKEDRV